MHPTVRILSSRAHHPLIRFLGKRTYPSDPNTPHAHPAAPVELRQRSTDFVNKFEASEKSAGKTAFSEFWEAPERFWRKDIGEAEITAILSGGASLH